MEATRAKAFDICSHVGQKYERLLGRLRSRQTGSMRPELTGPARTKSPGLAGQWLTILDGDDFRVLPEGHHSNLTVSLTCSL